MGEMGEENVLSNGHSRVPIRKLAKVIHILQSLSIHPTIHNFLSTNLKRTRQKNLGRTGYQGQPGS